MEQFKKATTAAKYVAVVLVFLATIGQAVYAAWFKPTGEDRADDVYAALRERIAVNERYFLAAVQEVAVLRAEVGVLRADLERSAKALTVPPLKPPTVSQPISLPATDGDGLNDEPGFHIGYVGEMVQSLKQRGAMPEVLPDAAPKR